MTSRGTPFTDTTFGAASRLVVTELLSPGVTMTMDWKAERAGNWLFHCHTINHIDEALRLGAAATAPQRRLRIVVTERSAPGRGRPSLAYVLQRTAREPARDSLELPGSTHELQQGEPTAITVVNRSRQPTAVHWHGMELESFFDGVAGWSGAGTRVAPIIAPGDSFVAHMTPPRVGTFIDQWSA